MEPSQPSAEFRSQCAADGAWQRLDGMELVAQARITGQLEPFEEPFALTYEAGLIVPVLRVKGKATLDVRCAAMFFKRALNDLRAVWVLLRSGYTSQAATVSASLYENALATVCLTLSQKNIDALLQSQSGELPWSPMEMAKMMVRAEVNAGKTSDFENGWRALYAHYVWLCQCKHPTLQSVLHDTSATRLKEEYVVMALPNVHESDIAFKASIAIQSLIRIHESIRAFAVALGFKEELPDDYAFASRLERARSLAWRAFEPHLKGKHPISIAGSWFTQKYPPVPKPTP